MQKRALAGTLVLSLAALGLTACEEKSSKMTLGNDGGGDCALSIDNLADTEWLFLKANPDKSEVPEHKTRMRFYSEDGKLKVKYNVGSVADMYTYDCEKKGEEQICKEEPKVKDWCQALIVGGGECTAETLRKIEPSLTDDEIKTGMEEAQANVAKYKDTEQWKAFELNNNNLGNKLRGLLYVKVDKTGCRLRVTDNFMTIYNGKRVEDSNPAGTNPFVKNEMGELLWENCTNNVDLVAKSSGDLPQDGQTELKHGAGSAVHYWFLNQSVLKPIEGCSFTFDTWYDGKPGEKGLKPETDTSGKEPILKWHVEKTWDAPSATREGNVTTWVVKAQCDDEKKLGEGWKDSQMVACNAILVQ